MQDIRPYIQAKFSLLLVVTHEEERIVRDLRRNYPQKRIPVWTQSQGIQYKGAVPSGGVPAGAHENDPEGLLKAIRDTKGNSPSIFVLKDVVPFLKAPNVCRRMRDLHSTLQNKEVWVVMTSPRREIPDELQDVVTILDFDLPDKAHLAEVVRAAAEAFEQTDCDFESVADALAGLSEAQASNALALSKAQVGEINIEVVLDEKARAISQDGTIETMDVDVELDKDVAGYGRLIKWLHERRSAFSEKARAFGLPTPKGVLLVGVPGAGKSLVCKALAKTWGLPLMRCDVGALFAGVVGQSEANVRKLIKQAEAASPVILWLDEIDKGLSVSTGSHSGDSGTGARVLATLLSWLQDKTKPVFVVATANNPEDLPAETIRRGRWDEIFALGLPGLKERKAIFRIHMAKKGRSVDGIDLDLLSSESDGFTGAEIEGAVLNSLHTAFNDGERDILEADLLYECQNIVPLSKSSESDVNRMLEWAASRAVNASFPDDEIEEEVEEAGVSGRFAGMN